MKEGWGQTLTIVGTIVAGMTWISTQHAGIYEKMNEKHLEIYERFVAIEIEHVIIRNRLTRGGWSRGQEQQSNDALREAAKGSHEVPPLPPLPPVTSGFGYNGSR